jgi:hypothetical protein
MTVVDDLLFETRAMQKSLEVEVHLAHDDTMKVIEMTHENFWKHNTEVLKKIYRQALTVIALRDGNFESIKASNPGMRAWMDDVEQSPLL